VLANELTEPVANSCAILISAATAAIAAVADCRCRWKLPYRTLRRHISIEGTDLLYGADADSVRLAQRTIDGARFCYAHLGAVHKRGNIGRIGVTIADESATSERLINSRFKRPVTGIQVTVLLYCANMYAGAAISFRDSKQPSVSDVPSAIDQRKVSHRNRKVIAD
jgi:hypothetical protein